MLGLLLPRLAAALPARLEGRQLPLEPPSLQHTARRGVVVEALKLIRILREVVELARAETLAVEAQGLRVDEPRGLSARARAHGEERRYAPLSRRRVLDQEAPAPGRALAAQELNLPPSTR